MFATTTKILLVEDVPLRERVARNILANAGFQNITQISDLSAIGLHLQQALTERTPYGLVIIDWDNLSTRTLAMFHKLHQDPSIPQIPYLLLTVDTDRDHILTAIRAGINAFIAKPFASDALLEKMRELWQSSPKAA